jgi:sodium/hydrogen exchanger 8
VNCVDDCPVEHGLLSFADAVFTYDAGTTADDCVLDGVVKNCCETRTPVCIEYCLHMHANDDQSDPGLALKLADDYMNTPWTLYASIDLFIGGLTSDVSEALNHLLQHALVPQISYGATSDTLGGAEGEEDFPTFLRTVPSDALLVNGVVALTEYAEWRMMSILAVDKEFGRAVAENLYTQLNNLDNKVAVPAHKLFTVDNVAEHLLFIRDKTESRVIFLHCTSMDALHVLKIASDLDMLGDGWAWVGSEWAQDVIIDEITVVDDEFDMFEDEGEKTAFLEELSGIVAFRATNDNLNANIKGAIDFEVLAKTGSDQRRFNDVRSQEFQCDKLVGTTHVSQYAYFAYDAMLLGATAIHRSLAKGNLAKEFDKTMVEINDMEGATTVPNAATGSIALDQYGDRIMAYDMVNFVAGEGEGEFEWKVVGNYVPCEDPGAAEMCTADQEEEGWGMFLYGNNQDHPQYDIDLAIRWPGGSTQTPSDRTMGHLSMQALYLFFFLTFIIFSICAGNFLHAHEFYVLPESGATILFGLLLGSVLKLVSHMWHMEGELAAMTEFDTDLFSLLLLPIIIFAAGFNLRKKDLFSNLPPICLTAYFGTTISTIMIGMGCYWFGSKGYFEFGSMSIPESLTYGALISAVDPVATLAVFGALGVETDLNMRVFGESVINDGVSIVLFRVFGQYISEEFTMASAADGVRRFFQIQILSIIVGILAALFLAFVMKYARLHAHTLECAIVLIGSYVAYAGAETIGASGIIASLVCGIAMNHWTYHNFTYDGEVLTRRTVKMFSLLADTVIFFQVGQNIVVHTSQSATGQDWSFIGITIGLCLVSRAFNIMPLLSLYNICAAEDKKVPFKHMLVMWWAGLRGAIAFALALHFPSQNVHVVISTCMWVILFTVFILGGTCVSFLELMDVKFGVESNDVQDFKKSKQLGAMKNPLQKFDRKVLLPLVTWRFETDGNDTYIENPEEARAYRKGIPWEPAEH